MLGLHPAASFRGKIEGMTMKSLIAIIILSLASVAWSQTPAPATQPTTRPAGTAQTADDMLKQLLLPSRPARGIPIEPVPNVPRFDVASSPSKTIAPNPPAVPLTREGTIIFDRKGRLNRTPDGQHEFTFDSDGQAMKDPPMIVLPNLKLMAMENAIKNSGRELRFSITGTVTEYNARNYVLLEKAVVVPE